jgi:putative DNA primase/helicase
MEPLVHFSTENSEGSSLKNNLGNIPTKLKALRNWVCYRLDKSPVDPKTGHDAKANDPESWGTFDQAVRYWEAHKDNGIAGIGYEFSYYDPCTGIDLDKCRDPDTGELRYRTKVFLEYLDSYSETSPSKTGVHIISEAKWPSPTGNQKKLPCGMKIEVYDRMRYFTMTGAHLGGRTTIEKRQEQVTALHRAVFNKTDDTPKAPGPSPTLELSDQELIYKACAADDGGRFKRLWEGDTAGYPSLSEADYALVHKLAFWTNRDSQRIDRLFRQSGLCKDDPERLKKWERLASTTIEKAIANTLEGYTSGQKKRKLQKRGANTANKPQLQVIDGGEQPGEAQGQGDPRGLRLTDWGNAERLVDKHGQDLRYCHLWQKWLIWDGTRWITDDTGEVYRRAKDVVAALYARAAEALDKNTRKEIAQFATRSEADIKQKAMISSARSEPGIPILPKDLDQDPWLFNVLNGTLDLRTGKLRPHRREDLITKLAPVQFDPEAECPAWWEFLKRIFDSNFTLIEYLQKATGYTLTGSTIEQCLFFLFGLGANGKSTFLEIIHTLSGDYAQRTSSETFLMKKSGGIPNDVAALRGARLVGAVEVEAGRRLAEVLIKEMTGGDRISARFLHAEWFTFKPEFKIFLAANHKPVIRGTDHAIWRRIRLIPFSVQIPKAEQDKELPEMLKAELSGILNWALEGCILWQDQGLNPPQEVCDATQGYREEMDPLADFLTECCILSPAAEVMAAELFKAYSSWTGTNGIKQPMSQTDFGMRLKDRGLKNPQETKGPNKGRKKWQGIGLREMGRGV